MNKNILVIDDVRTLDLYTDKVTYARTGEGGLDQLRKGGWDELHLDHDLGMKITAETSGGILVAKEEVAMSGLGVLLTAHVENIPLPPVVRIISSNPVGVKNIADCLINDFNYKAAGFTGRMFIKDQSNG